MKIGNGLAKNDLFATLAACTILGGCGSSAAPPATSPNKGTAHSGAVQLRDKLNAMSVPDRLKYLKEHPGAAGQAMGAQGAMGPASGMAPGEAAGQKGP